MSCVAIFTISSFLCGLAPNLATLIFFECCRAPAAGFAAERTSDPGGHLRPGETGYGLCRLRYGRGRRAAIGPPLGGFITDNYSWRWIFYVDVPIGIISLLLTSRVISDPALTRAARRGIKIDYIGLGLLALGLGALQVVLDKGQRDDWFGSNFILSLTVISVTALISVIFWEWHRHPIIDLKFFRDRSFAIGNSMMFMLGFILLGTTLLLPLFIQTLMGYPAEHAVWR